MWYNVDKPKGVISADTGRKESTVNVSESNRPTSDTSARRIAISAVDQMLQNGEIEGDDASVRLARAAFRECAIYEQARRDMLSCDELDEEIRIKDDFPHTYQDKYDGGKSKRAHCQPSYALKLSLEPGTYHEDCICDGMRELYITTRAGLLKGETNERAEGVGADRAESDAVARGEEQGGNGSDAEEGPDILPGQPGAPRIPGE